MNNIHIYTYVITPRLTYVCEALFCQLMGISFQLETDWLRFINIQNPKIAYTPSAPDINVLWIKSNQLLFETDIQTQDYTVLEWKDVKTIALGAHNETAVCPFDLFSTIFYLLSRYEEYTCLDRDEHGRFSAFSSILYKENLLEYPIVNQLAIAFQKVIHSSYPHIVYKSANYSFIPTIDIDIALAYRAKGWKRTLGGLMNDTLSLDFSRILDRFKSLLHIQKDPYDVFHYFEKAFRNTKPVFFLLMGNYGDFDKNNDTQNADYKRIINKISTNYDVGVHPSYQSNDNLEVLKKEIKRVATLSHQPIVRSRQHYLKLSLPTTYRQLLEMGIKEDWTLGFAERVGWRAGIATPFYWFDLERNAATDLLLYPTAAMDVTLQQYMKYSPEKARKTLETLANRCKAVDGTFITIWHNSSFYDQEGWKGWDSVFEYMIATGQKN